MRSTFFALLLVGIISVIGYVFVTNYNAASTPLYRTTAIKKGDVLSLIAATGTLQPEEVVDVGAQVAGRIKDFGIDPIDADQKKRIDYGSIVHQGTVLAYIDDEEYQAQFAQVQASLQHAKADLMQCEAKLVQAEADLKRSESLVKLQDIPGAKRPIKGIADSDYETSVMNQKVTAANVELAKATIAQQEAALRMAQTNLGYTVIRSPVEGTIITRRVNIGQTVVASLNAPSLFLLAKDLSKMQIWVAVNEADVGRIKPGMPVRFTVDAFPKDIFRGKVLQIRDNANMTQNVVTYTVVVTFDNSDKKLRPFFTANVQFEAEERDDVLTVPNVALRWRPKDSQLEPKGKEASGEKREGKRKGPGGDTGDATARVKPLEPRSDRGKLWVQDGEYVRPIEVQVGISDSVVTEVSGEGLTEGMEIVIGEARKDVVATDDTTNPFAPKFGGKKGPGR